MTIFNTNKYQYASYLDLTGSDQIVDVIKSFFYGFTSRHQAVVPQNEHLKQGKKYYLVKSEANKKNHLL